MLLADHPTSMNLPGDSASKLLRDIACHLGKQQSTLDRQLALMEQVAAKQARLEGLLIDRDLNLSPRRFPTDLSLQRDVSSSTHNEVPCFDLPIEEEDPPTPPTEGRADCSQSAGPSDASPVRDSSFITIRAVGRRTSSNLNPDLNALSQSAPSPETDSETSRLRSPFKDRLRAFVLSGTFDMVMIIIIGVNVLCVATEIELRGQGTGFALGVEVNAGPSWNPERVFFLLEVSFTCVYWVEIILRVWALRGRFLKSATMLYDLSVVLLCSFDIARRLGSISIGGLNLGAVLRQTRVIRAVKVLRLMHNFHDLQVIITTLRRSVVSLCWSLLVLLLIISFATIVMCEFVRYEIDDVSFDVELREWAFEHFGTTSRGLLTMFEATFSTKWVDICRPLTVEFSAWYSIFWVTYIVAVNFATIRILGAMFIKEAMCVSRMEEEKEALAKLKEREKEANNLRTLFKMADLDNSGSLEKDEIEQLLTRPDTEELLQSMGLSLDEIFVVAQVCTMDDGTVDYEEFMDASLKMQASVKAMDTIQLAHSMLELRRQVDSIKGDLVSALGLLRGLGLHRTVHRAPLEPPAKLLGL